MHAPTALDRARVHERLTAKLAAGAGAPVASRSASLLRWGVGALTVAGVIAGVWFGSPLIGERAPSISLAKLVHVQSLRPRVEPNAEVEHSVDVAEPAPQPLRVSHAAVTRTRNSAPPSAAPTDLLREEAMLLGRARAAIRQNDLAEARGILRVHASRFPAGALVEEREAAGVLCACADSALNADESLAQFRARYPQSMSLPALAAACSRGRP